MRLRPLQRLAGETAGSVSMITAFSFLSMLGAAALAIDVGSMFLQARKLQGIADLAAMSAARDIPHATAAAQATAAANGWGKPLSVAVTLGVYKPDPAVAAAQRFVAGGNNPNAAKVVVSGDTDLFFGRLLVGANTTRITRQATAARADLASFPGWPRCRAASPTNCSAP